jgi:hypothetical protein
MTWHKCSNADLLWPYGLGLIFKLQVWCKPDASTARTKCVLLPRVSANQVLAQNVRSGIYRICVYRFTRNAHKLILFLLVTYGNLTAVTMALQISGLSHLVKIYQHFRKTRNPNFWAEDKARFFLSTIQYLAGYELQGVIHQKTVMFSSCTHLLYGTLQS